MKINEKVKMMPGYQMHVKAIWSLMYLLYILAHVDVRRIRDRHVQIDRIGIQRNKRNTDQPLSCVLAEVTEKSKKNLHVRNKRNEVIANISEGM